MPGWRCSSSWPGTARHTSACRPQKADSASRAQILRPSPHTHDHLQMRQQATSRTLRLPPATVPTYKASCENVNFPLAMSEGCVRIKPPSENSVLHSCSTEWLLRIIWPYPPTQSYSMSIASLLELERKEAKLERELPSFLCPPDQ